MRDVAPVDGDAARAQLDDPVEAHEDAGLAWSGLGLAGKVRVELEVKVRVRAKGWGNGWGSDARLARAGATDQAYLLARA